MMPLIRGTHDPPNADSPKQMTIRNMKTDSSTPGNPSSLFRPRVGAVSARAAMVGVLGVLAAAPSARAGVTMPTLWTENGHSYQVVVVPDGIVWSDARDAAAASGGHLVTLTSEAENGFVHGLIADEATAWVSSGIAPNQTLRSGGATVGPFFDGAGSILLRAAGSIVGSPNRQYVTDWWWRQTGLTTAGQPAAWTTRYDLFQQGVASFGGGHVTAIAGAEPR